MGTSSGSSKLRLTTFFEEKRIIFISLGIGLAHFQYGYDSSAVSGFQAMPGFLALYGYKDPTSTIGYNIHLKVQQLIQSFMNLGALVACSAMYVVGDRISRRVALWIACAIGIVAITLQIVSTTFAALYAGRLLLGFSNGIFVPYSIMYMSEVSPSHLRTSIVGLVVFHLVTGALFGILVDDYTNKGNGRGSYQKPLGVMYAVPLIIGTILAFLPDTPRYYISHGMPDKAAAAIRELRGISDAECIQTQVADMERAWAEEQEQHNSVRFKDMFSGSDLRRTIISVTASVSQTATGILFISGYSVYFYVQARVNDPFKFVLIGLAIGVTGNFGAFPALRYFNRRPLLLGSTIMMSILMFAIAIIYSVTGPESSNAGKALVGCCIVYTWFYALGAGPVLWSLASEAPSQRLRSQTIGLANALNFVFAWLCQFCTPYFINPTSLNWGPKYCYIWGGSNLILFVFAYFVFPETKGRSLEQLDELFEEKVPMRKFASHVTRHQAVDADKDLRYQSEKDITAAHIENSA